MRETSARSYRLMEWRYGMKCLASIDCNATLPLGYFDFGMTPRAPMLFNTNPLNTNYPIPVQTVELGGARFHRSGKYSTYPANRRRSWTRGPPGPSGGQPVQAASMCRRRTQTARRSSDCSAERGTLARAA